MFSNYQIEKILNILTLNHAIFIGGSLGESFLSTDDIKILEVNGIKVKELYEKTNDPILLSIHLGILAQAIGVKEVKKLPFNEFLRYIKKGDHLELSRREQNSLEVIKRQTFNDIKKLQGQIFTDINQVAINSSQEDFLRKEVESGIREGKTIRDISREISIKTGDWGRNFDRIVAYNSQLAYEEGKALELIQQSGGEDVYVYKKVYQGACKNCVRLFLTEGVGSIPKIFKLEDLISNGNNIGRKVDSWRPVVGPVHPHCRCSLVRVDPSSKWNSKKQIFISEKQPLVKRRKVKVIINGKEYYV